MAFFIYYHERKSPLNTRDLSIFAQRELLHFCTALDIVFTNNT